MRWIRKTIAIAVTGAAFLLGGGAAAGALTSGSSPSVILAAPAARATPVTPAPTKTVTAPPSPVPTKTVTAPPAPVQTPAWQQPSSAPVAQPQFTNGSAVVAQYYQDITDHNYSAALASPRRHHVHVRLEGFQADIPDVGDRLRLGTALPLALRPPTAPAAAALALLDVGVAGSDLIATGQAAASPLLSGTGHCSSGSRPCSIMKAGGDFMLHPLANSGSPPGAPLAPAMTTRDIGVPRCHFPIAGHAPTPPG